MWPGPLPGPALGWAAAASGAGDAGLQFFGASALDAYRLGGLFPPQGSARRSRRSIARCSCGSSRMWCYGLSPPIKLLTFALCESNEVVLGTEHCRSLLPGSHARKGVSLETGILPALPPLEVRHGCALYALCWPRCPHKAAHRLSLGAGSYLPMGRRPDRA